ncbi:GntR family transcriptional regulator [Algoriphagus aquimarinus]|uniref:GntR family transcriptional regulator n=1 Tax=Algoriphagus aquimarinus TaxID=237018 RepID=UPI0030D8571B|tara:strand:+ start:1166 stop:1873 length:708 start_codon:yes stop_codon:yes gene_type:complete
MAEKVIYRIVQKDLRRSIIEGKYKVGDLLPSENELCSKYGIARMTVRNALSNLETEGLIERQKGKGSIVRLKRKSIELLSIKGFTEIMKGKERKIDTVFLQKPILLGWEDGFYWPLSEEEIISKCIYLKRVRMSAEKPIMMEKTYLSNMNLPSFCTEEFINKSLFDTLIVNHDIEMTGVVQKFRAIPANAELADSLQLIVGAPVLEIIRKLTTNREGFFVYSFAYCNTDDFTIEA